MNKIKLKPQGKLKLKGLQKREPGKQIIEIMNEREVITIYSMLINYFGLWKYSLIIDILLYLLNLIELYT